MKNNNENSTGKILIYQNEKGDTKIDAYFEDETIWMTQKSMSELFDVGVAAISKHLQNIYDENELNIDATISKMEIVQQEGIRSVKRLVDFYNLDAIISVGYRVNSRKATMFRIWATGILKEYIKKGFVMNDERLKNPKEFGADYFDELLERIRDIRTSEKRVYQKVKDIYSTSIDYDKNAVRTELFYKSVQNKLEYAATGFTAPEIIAQRADAQKDNMGLKTFKGAKVRKSDITIAKNYLDTDEIDMLNRIVTMYLDYAELQAKNKIPMNMSDWENKLNEFLKFNGKEILQDYGKISREIADKLAIEQYEKYDKNRRIIEANLDELDEKINKLKQ